MCGASEGRPLRSRYRRARLPGRVAAVTALAVWSAACAVRHVEASGPPPDCGATPVQTPAAPAAPGTSATSAGAALRLVEDVSLPGSAVRFDYQSLDTTRDRLYIAHMNAGTLLVFDVAARRPVADLDGFGSVHGVLAVPELGKVFATATADHDVPVVDEETLRILARPGRIAYGDGLAYATTSRRVFVSDESPTGLELVIDAVADSAVGAIRLGGEAGNTIYDPGSGCVLVAVQTQQQVVAIDPDADSIVGRYDIEGAEHPHGLALDAARRLLFVADEQNASLFVVDLGSMRVLDRQGVGRSPDVLAFDPGIGRLYVAAESGTVSVFEEAGRGLVPLGRLDMPSAHTVAVDPRSHLVYLPLERVDGRPVLRIMEPLP
jgi:DNA-binding beta-propeller fold protein YncE